MPSGFTNFSFQPYHEYNMTSSEPDEASVAFSFYTEVSLILKTVVFQIIDLVFLPPPTKAAYALLGKSLSTNLHSRISLCSLLGCRPLRGLHLRVGRQLRRNPCHAQQTVEADVFASGE